jgi:MFS family permease
MGEAPPVSEAGGTGRKKRGADVGRIGECQPHRGFMMVTSIGYGGFLLGPPLVGGLAEAIGLRAALGVIAVAAAAVFALSLRLREPKARTATEGGAGAP